MARRSSSPLALLNALELQGKELDKARIVVLGAGAAGIAAVRLLIAMGAHRRTSWSSIAMASSISAARTSTPSSVSRSRPKHALADAMHGADVFIGVSGPDLVSAEMVASMAEKADRVRVVESGARDPARGGKSGAQRFDHGGGPIDYPNQVNNVLGFPFIFRGTLDVRASRINEDMQIAAVHALKELTHQPVPQEVFDAYGLQSLAFGPTHPAQALDARLKDVIPPAVARAAVESGVARAPWPEHYPAF